MGDTVGAIVFNIPHFFSEWKGVARGVARLRSVFFLFIYFSFPAFTPLTHTRAWFAGAPLVVVVVQVRHPQFTFRASYTK